MFLNVVSVDAFLISDGSSFQSRGAATLKSGGRSPNLSLVRGTMRSPLEAECMADRNKVAAACR